MDDYDINSSTDFGSSNSHYMDDYDVNPATGLPMINGSSVDVSGNGFGSSNNSFDNDNSFDDYQNKTTNVKALDKRIGYLFLVIAIIHISFLAYCIITH